MAMGPLTIGRPTEAKINSTSNDSNGRTTKGGNGFAIITSNLGSGANAAYNDYQALRDPLIISPKRNHV